MTPPSRPPRTSHQPLHNHLGGSSHDLKEGVRPARQTCPMPTSYTALASRMVDQINQIKTKVVFKASLQVRAYARNMRPRAYARKMKLRAYARTDPCPMEPSPGGRARPLVRISKIGGFQHPIYAQMTPENFKLKKVEKYAHFRRPSVGLGGGLGSQWGFAIPPFSK